MDVCVIGAGIAGLSTAYTLARQGVSVAVLDRGRVGRGETSRTTAHLASALDDGFHELERLFGQDALSVDLHISPEQLVTDYIHRLIEYPGALGSRASIEDHLHEPHVIGGGGI